jgi:adhesin transport system outer membrane protein
MALFMAPFVLLAGLNSAQADSLGDAIRLTLDQHPEISRDRANSHVARQSVDAARSGYFPKIDLSGNIGVELTDSPSTRGRGNDVVRMIRSEASGTFTQMLFDGFETSSRVDGSRAQSRSADYQVKATAERLGFRVTAVYLAVLRYTKLTEIAKANVGRHSQVLGNLRELREAGQNTSVDVDRVASRLARAQREFEDVDGQRREVVARFTETVGKAPDGLARPAAPTYEEPVTMENAVTRALTGNPIVHVAREALSASKAEHELSRVSFFPRLDLELTGSSADNQDGVSGQSTDFTAMVRMRFNLFNGFATIAGSRRTFETARAAAEDEGEVRRTLRENVRTALDRLKSERARLKPLREGFRESQNVALAYDEQFTVGRRSLIDLLDAANESFTFASDLTQAEYDELLASYRLAFQLGGFLKLFDITVEKMQTATAATPIANPIAIVAP